MSLGDPGKTGFKVIDLQAKKDDTLATFHQVNGWIHDTGASMHVTWSNKCTKNVCKMQA